MTGARRIECHCGCGCWFYWHRAPGRPPQFINREHYLKQRNRVRNQRRLVERVKQGVG